MELWLGRLKFLFDQKETERERENVIVYGTNLIIYVWASIKAIGLPSRFVGVHLDDDGIH